MPGAHRDVAANGPVAIERGTYVFSLPAQGRTPTMTTPGKYLVSWHKVNGEWQQAAAIWSDDTPPPAGSWSPGAHAHQHR